MDTERYESLMTSLAAWRRPRLMFVVVGLVLTGCGGDKSGTAGPMSGGTSAPTSTISAPPATALPATFPMTTTAPAPAPTGTVRPTATPPPTPTTPPDLDVSAVGTLAATLELGGVPYDLAWVGNLLWVTNSIEGTISVIDPATNTVVDTVVADAPSSVDTHGWGPISASTDAVWAAFNNGVTEFTMPLLRFDPATRAKVAEIQINFGITDIAVGAGSVWVAGFRENTLARVDPATGTVAATFDIPAPLAVIAGDTAVWVTSMAGSKVVRIDPATNQVAAEVRLPAAALWLADAGDAIWVTTGAPQVVRIDPLTNELADEPIPMTDTPGNIAITPTGVWVGIDSMQVQGRGLVRIDPVTAQIIATASAPTGVREMVGNATSLWLISGPTLVRIDLAQ